MSKEHGVKTTAGFIRPIIRKSGNTSYQQYSLFWLLNILSPSSGNSIKLLFTNCLPKIPFKNTPLLHPGFSNASYYMYFKMNACTGKHLHIRENESTMITDKLHVSFSHRNHWVGTNVCQSPKKSFYQMMYWALHKEA
jgi:hypothetical protein